MLWKHHYDSLQASLHLDLKPLNWKSLQTKHLFCVPILFLWSYFTIICPHRGSTRADLYIYIFFLITGVDIISLSPYFGMEYLPNYKSNKHCIWRIYNGLVSYLWETAACSSTPCMKHLAWRGKVLLQFLLLIRSSHGLWFWFQSSFSSVCFGQQVTSAL